MSHWARWKLFFRSEIIHHGRHNTLGKGSNQWNSIAREEVSIGTDQEFREWISLFGRVELELLVETGELVNLCAREIVVRALQVLQESSLVV